MGALLLGASAKADAPSGRFVVSNGVILDTVTLLTWQQQSTDETAHVGFDDAYARCAQLTLGQKKWRLPTLPELHTIVDERRSQPALDPVFKGGGFHWSGTLYRGVAGIHWGMETATGHTVFKHDTDLAATVRCVY